MCLRDSIKTSIFVASGSILKLKAYMQNFAMLKKDYDLISRQIQKLSKEGHDIQLHIHPHWEDSIYNGKEWVFDTSRYKLSDFTEIAIDGIVRRYSQILEELTNQKPTVFRAGGWCIQPFEKLADSLYNYGIRIDSSIYPNGKNKTAKKSFDFSGSPDKNNWMFSTNPLIEDKNGRFLEIPISSLRTTPFFYLRFIFYKFYGGATYQASGDGFAIRNSKKQIFNQLLKPSFSVASIDGYKASLLNQCARKNKSQLVLIGHPKAFSRYSLKKVEEFIKLRSKDSIFTTYTRYNG